MLKEISYVAIFFMINLKYSNEGSTKKPNWIPKIVGGTPVPIKRFPSMVQLYNLGDMCAGNIINSWTVLTAAHCFDFNRNVDDVVIQVGSRYVYDFNAVSYAVTLIKIHEKYNVTQLFACDIALVFVDRKIKFTSTTKKAVLVDNTRWMNKRETNFTATGWGWTSYGGELSKKGLMMAHLRFIPNDECGKMHSMSFSEDMFCLYGDGARDTCKGDSGGGVLWHGMIVGLTSHGDGCAQVRKPSVYSNVYYFRDWIKEKEQEFTKNFCKITNQRNIHRQMSSLEDLK